MKAIPKPYEIYRHFKGNTYQILNIAIHSETGEQMVVYQQLYQPYEVYVRPLEMFMSRVDCENYPNVTQEYRFERIQLQKKQPQKVTVSETKVPQEVVLQEVTVQEENIAQEAAEQEEEKEQEPALDPNLLRFLEADSYEEKLEVLNLVHPQITDAMIDTMAVSLDMEVKPGDIEQRYSELLNCLLTLEHFECNRLR